MIASGDVVLVDELRKRPRLEAIAGNEQYRVSIPCLNGATSVLEHVDCGSTAGAAVHEPGAAETEADGQVDGTVRGERERRDAEAVHLSWTDAGVLERVSCGSGEDVRSRESLGRFAKQRRLADARKQRLGVAQVRPRPRWNGPTAGAG